MQQESLAFDLVKTVICARDEGRALSPPFDTAWQMLRMELSPAHRVIVDELAWAPASKSDLAFVISGVQHQFEKDPSLKPEFLAFLAEVKPFTASEEQFAMPVVPAGAVVMAAKPELTLSEVVTPAPSFATASSQQRPKHEAAPASLNDNFKAAWAAKAKGDTVAPTSAAPVVVPTANAANETPKLATTQSNYPPRVKPTEAAVAKTKPWYLRLWPIGVFACILVAGIIMAVSAFSDDGEQLTNLEKYDQLTSKGSYGAGQSTGANNVNTVDRSDSDDAVRSRELEALAKQEAANKNWGPAANHQLAALLLANHVYAADDVQLGKKHLTLARYYQQADSSILASAHVRQARHIFGTTQQNVDQDDLAEQASLTSLLGIGS